MYSTCQISHIPVFQIILSCSLCAHAKFTELWENISINFSNAK